MSGRLRFAHVMWLAVVCLAGDIVPGAAQGQDVETATVPDFRDVASVNPFQDDGLRQAQFAPAPAAPVAVPPAPAQPPRFRPGARSSYTRLARVPNMFGDSISPSGQLFADSEFRPQGAAIDLPLSGGAGRSKISENDKGLPMDRVYFLYNHFNNALVADENIVADGQNDIDVDRYTLGLEKTLFDERASIGIRVPLVRPFEFSEPGVSVTSGELGNIGLILKVLLYGNEDETFALGGGVTTEIPTGSDIEARFGDTELVIENESVHVLPFLSALLRPDERWFFQGSMQLDFAANGNPIQFQAPLEPRLQPGVLNDQTLLYLDASMGRWFFRNENSRWFKGLAGVVELHYTTSLQDADVVAFAPPTQTFTLTNVANRFDVLNLTAGLHAQFDELTNVRVGCVVPLRNGFDRAFDSEVQVSVNRHY